MEISAWRAGPARAESIDGDCAIIFFKRLYLPDKSKPVCGETMDKYHGIAGTGVDVMQVVALILEIRFTQGVRVEAGCIGKDHCWIG